MILFRCICRSVGLTLPLKEVDYKYYTNTPVRPGRMKDEVTVDDNVSGSRVKCRLCNIETSRTYSRDLAEVLWNTKQENKWDEFKVAVSDARHEANKNWERKIRMPDGNHRRST